MANKQNVIKLQAPFEKIKLSSPIPEVNLYRAVIMQMIIDATNISSNPEMVKNEIQAKEWLFEDNEDFPIACDNADLSIDIVRQTARDLINAHKMKNSVIDCLYHRN